MLVEDPSKSRHSIFRQHANRSALTKHSLASVLQIVLAGAGIERSTMIPRPSVSSLDYHLTVQVMFDEDLLYQRAQDPILHLRRLPTHNPVHQDLEVSLLLSVDTGVEKVYL